MNKKLKILIVEDSENDAIQMVEYLRRDGYNIVFKRVETGEDMKYSLKQESWDIVLSDFYLPSFSGLEALQIIKDMELDIPIIIISGAIGEETAVTAIKAGAYDYLLKNNLNRLVMKIEHVLKEFEQYRSRKKAERALQDSERQYRLLIETTIDGLAIIDETAVLTFVNDSFCEMIGYSAEELINTSVHDYFDGNNKEILKEKLIRRKNGEKESYEIVWTKKTGEKLHTILSPRVINDDDGTFKGSFGVIIVITKRKLAEDALRISEEMHRITLENISDAVFITDDTGKFTYICSNIANAFGYSVKEIQSFGNVSSILGAPPVPIEELPEDSELRNIEWETTHKSGKVLSLLVHIKKVSIEDGTILYTCHDITDRKKATEALKESERRYRELFEYSPVSLWEEDFSEVKNALDKLKETGIKDFRKYFEEHPEEIQNIASKVKILDINVATLKLYGAKNKEELLGNLDKVFNDESFDAFKEELIALAEGKTSLSMKLTNITLDGRMITIIMGLSVSTAYEETLSRVLISILDITKEKKAELEQKKNIAFLEHLDKINTAIQTAENLEEVILSTLEAIQEIFESDRAWLLYPCDPTALSWHVPMEVARSEYPGAFILKEDIPMSDEIAEVLQTALEIDGPVAYDPTTPHRLPKETAEEFVYRSQLVIAIYPKIGLPWMLGMHQCSYVRTWTEEEIRTFNQIAQRISEALNSFLYLRSLQESEEALRKSQQEYFTLFEESPVGLIYCDIEGNIQDINKTGLEIIGSPSKDQTKQINLLTFPPMINVGIDSDIQQCITGQKRIKSIREYTSAWDKQVHLRLENVPLFDSNLQIKGALVTFNDITEQIYAEKALKDVKEQEELYHKMLGHFVKNDLQTIVFNIGLLLRGQKEPRITKFLKKMEHAALQASKTINVVNYIFEVLQSDFQEQKTVLNILKELKDAIADLQTKSSLKHQITYVSRDLDRDILVDIHFRSIFDEIFFFLSKYKDKETKIKATITASHLPSHFYVTIQASKTPLIPNDVCIRLAEGITEKWEAQGHYIGLSFVSVIMQHYGGRFEIQTDDQTGNTFKLFFPQNLFGSINRKSGC